MHYLQRTIDTLDINTAVLLGEDIYTVYYAGEIKFMSDRHLALEVMIRNIRRLYATTT